MAFRYRVRSSWAFGGPLRRLAAALIGLFCVGSVLGAGSLPTSAPAQRGLLELQHTAWTVRDGAPPNIWALAQSRDGFLWLGTGGGLYRFDGLLFEHVIPATNADFGFRDVTALMALPSGELWIGYYAGGASVLQDGRLTNYSERDGIPSGWVTSIAREENGTIWLAARQGLGRFANGHWETVGERWNFHGPAAHWVLIDHNGTLWVAGGHTVVFLRKGSRAFEDTGIPSGYKSALAQGPDGSIWLASEAMAPRRLPSVTSEQLADRTRQVLPTEVPLEPGGLTPVKRIIVDRRGALWATDAVKGGVYRVGNAVREGRETFTESDGLTSNIAVPLLEDREGNIWVGTNMGLNRFRATNFVRETRIPADSRTGYSMVPGGGNSVLVGAGTTVYRLQGSHFEVLTNSLSAIRSAYRTPDGAIWLGQTDGLSQLRDRLLIRYPLPNPTHPVQYEYVKSITSDDSRELWVSVIDRGVMRFDGAAWSSARGPPGLPNVAPSMLWTDSKGRRWFGYADGSVLMLDSGGTHAYGINEGLNVGPITAIRSAGHDVLVAGEWGLARFDGTRFQSLMASIAPPFCGITGIVETADHEIWLNGCRGVVRIAAAELQRALIHRDDSVRYQLFGLQDGLPGFAQQGDDSTAVSTEDGRIWFATNHGVAWIDPAHLVHDSLAPSVVIRSVLADGRSYTPNGEVKLLENTRSVRIDYTAPCLSVPERVRFRYRMQGLDETWHDGVSGRQVIYANLRAGKYKFQVIASNSDGVWNNSGATLTLIVPPTFLESPWFSALCVLAAGIVLWALYLLRMRQVKTRMRVKLRERHAERERIARDLHDTLLQGMQGMLLRFQNATEAIPSELRARELMEQALDRADDVLREGREQLTGLRSSAPDLCEALEGFGDELALDYSTEFDMSVEGTERPLDSVVRNEVYRIGAEALANAFNHANARKISAQLTFARKGLLLSVVDDGVGFDVARQQREAAPGHYGLKGMGERASRLRARLIVQSRIGEGTRVELRVPAALAYSGGRAGALRNALARFFGTDRRGGLE